MKNDPLAGIPRGKIEVFTNVKGKNSFSKVKWTPGHRLIFKPRAFAYWVNALSNELAVHLHIFHLLI